MSLEERRKAREAYRRANQKIHALQTQKQELAEAAWPVESIVEFRKGVMTFPMQAQVQIVQGERDRLRVLNLVTGTLRWISVFDLTEEFRRKHTP